MQSAKKNHLTGLQIRFMPPHLKILIIFVHAHYQQYITTYTYYTRQKQIKLKQAQLAKTMDLIREAAAKLF